MNKKPRLLATLLVAFGLTLTAGAQLPKETETVAQASIARTQISREHETAIRKMMRVTGMIDMIGQLTEQMVTQLKQGAPAGVPAEFWTKAREKRMKVEDLVQRLVPVYAKYCSLEDLKTINAFFESPAGQRYVANMTPMMQENMKIGQAWGQEVSQKVIDDLQAELRRSGAAGGTAVPGIGK